MKRLMTILGVLMMAGCASYQHLQSADALKIAALRAIGHEQVAWLSHDTAAVPAGMDSLVDLKKMQANVDDVAVAGSDGTVTTSYWYTGKFSTADGPREGTLTVQRRLHFRRDDRGAWTQSAPPEEIARNASWSSSRATS
jgi:hypothetical protein